MAPLVMIFEVCLLFHSLVAGGGLDYLGDLCLGLGIAVI